MELKSVNAMYSQLKSSAKKRGIRFTLEKTDLWDLDYPLTCPVLGIPLTQNKSAAKDNSFSVDRIDNSKGYEPGNIIIVSNRANKLKGDASLEELKLIVEYYK